MRSNITKFARRLEGLPFFFDRTRLGQSVGRLRRFMIGIISTSSHQTDVPIPFKSPPRSILSMQGSCAHCRSILLSIDADKKRRKVPTSVLRRYDVAL